MPQFHVVRAPALMQIKLRVYCPTEPTFVVSDQESNSGSQGNELETLPLSSLRGEIKIKRLIKPNIWQTSKIVILVFLSMSISDLPVFFQTEKRCCLETVSPLPPSNAKVTF